MNRFLLHSAAAALLWHVFAPASQAQLVQVGPGYVKAPFVRVFWNYDGSSYVRAPFVSVHSPGYHWAYVPTSERLRRDLIASAAELNHSLARFKTGDAWQKYLALPPGIDNAGQPRDDAEAAQLAADLRQTLSRFDATRQNGDYHMIAGLPAFVATHDCLAAYLKQVQVQPPRPGAEELPLPQHED